jgi:hypothetical protein
MSKLSAPVVVTVGVLAGSMLAACGGASDGPHKNPPAPDAQPHANPPGHPDGPHENPPGPGDEAEQQHDHDHDHADGHTNPPGPEKGETNMPANPPAPGAD